MRRLVGAALAAIVAIGLTVLAPVAAARTGGKQSFHGIIVASGESGTRTVVDTLIVGRGVVGGAGRVVEVANGPGDPESLSRDDVVFRRGRLHLATTTISVSPSVNLQTCVVHVLIKQTQKIQGGTGAFRHAAGSFTGRLRGRGVAARKPDGSCSEDLSELLEVAVFSMRGTLSL